MNFNFNEDLFAACDARKKRSWDEEKKLRQALQKKLQVEEIHDLVKLCKLFKEKQEQEQFEQEQLQQEDELPMWRPVLKRQHAYTRRGDDSEEEDDEDDD